MMKIDRTRMFLGILVVNTNNESVPVQCGSPIQLTLFFHFPVLNRFVVFFIVIIMLSYVFHRIPNRRVVSALPVVRVAV